ncbi:MAG: glycosyltransferase family protein [Gammaproteobacteria bacterium]
MKIGIIIQARLASTRLPGKVLKCLPCSSNITVLEQVIRRLKKSRLANEIVVATTTSIEDDEIIKIAQKEHVGWFRGSKEDVLSRYYLCSKEKSLDIIVRITSDCPCIDPEIVDKVIAAHIKAKTDYTFSCTEKVFSNGMDVEVFNIDVLKEAFLKGKDPYEREHVTPYFYRNSVCCNILKVELFRSQIGFPIRITLDTEEDYCLLCAVYDFLYAKDHYFGMKKIVDLFMRKPWLLLISKNVRQKKYCASIQDEIKEAAKILDLQGLKMASNLLKKTKN